MRKEVIKMRVADLREGQEVELIKPDPRVGPWSAHLRGKVVKGDGMPLYYQPMPGGWKPLGRGHRPHTTVRFENMVTYYQEPLSSLRAV
mgnify:CR=1 FL=1